ncbi:LytR/AlgR family response regulator transcription factor [Yeosuana sp.]|uniref:LytR/AlgR family response regulator transcription factor n=1 Tax=Yeosuana sp. TaxID=2529388 RepID=UPI00404AB99D
MKAKTIIIDDEPLAIDVVYEYCKTIDFIEVVATFTSAVEALQFLNKNEVDLMFLDIEMPRLNGLDFLQTFNKKIVVIITTAYPDYALDGYENNAIDYLLKPISYKRFLKAISKVSIFFKFKQISKNDAIFMDNDKLSTNFIFVKSEYENVKIDLQNIKYIEGLKDYIRINLANGKYVLTLSNFTNILEKINHPNFIRVHNSYIVNLNHIKSIQKNRILIEDKRIPISETYKKDFFEKIKLQ